MYDIAGSIPEGVVSELDAGTNLLITGPPMIGKRELALDVLADGHEDGDGVLFIMTRAGAADVIEDLDQRCPTLDRERIGVIDCSGSDDQKAIRDITIERLSSPGDLTGISIGTAKLLRYFSGQDISQIRHGLISVSTLLQYLDLNTVFKFLHIYTQRINDTQGLGIFTLDPTAHEPHQVNTLMSEFDGVIELRESDTGERELRLRGLTEAPRAWHPI